MGKSNCVKQKANCPFQTVKIIGQNSKAVQNVTKLPSYSWRDGLSSSLNNSKHETNTEQ